MDSTDPSKLMSVTTFIKEQNNEEPTEEENSEEPPNKKAKVEEADVNESSEEGTEAEDKDEKEGGEFIYCFACCCFSQSLVFYRIKILKIQEERYHYESL